MREKREMEMETEREKEKRREGERESERKRETRERKRGERERERVGARERARERWRQGTGDRNVLLPETVLILSPTTRTPGRFYRTGAVVGPCSVDDLRSCAVTFTVTTKPPFFCHQYGLDGPGPVGPARYPSRSREI